VTNERSRPDPWILDNPRLAHDCGLALTSARLNAIDAAVEASGLSPLPEYDSDQTPEQQTAVEIGRAVFEAVMQTIGKDDALRARGEVADVTVAELFVAFGHGL
jgi:hypothetical protein